METTFRLRRGTAATWAAKNPILQAGEPGVETDGTRYFKIGNGIDRWLDLPVISGSGAPGPSGKSAYQVAVDNGYLGTEVEWLLSLHGPKGDTGLKGDPGDAGLDGPPGIGAAFPILEHYGFVSASGDPMQFSNVSTMTSGTLWVSRLWVPANKALTNLWCLVYSGGVYDGVASGNKFAVYDDNGIKLGETADTPTFWTSGGWRGGPIVGGPIAAQTTGRWIYMAVCAVGLSTPANIAYRIGNDADSVQRGPAGGRRRNFLQGGSSGVPASFNPDTFGSISGYCPMLAIS